MSKASNFEIEAEIFRKMGSAGLGPREIEVNSVFRVEEYIDGRPLTMLELRNPFIAETLMQMLCETNFDPSLK